MAAPVNANVSSILQEMTNIRSEIKSAFVGAKQRAGDRKEALNIRMKVSLKDQDFIFHCIS